MSKFILGITGGVASGKSTLSGFFAERGAARISSDEIARNLLAPNSEMTRDVLTRFGADIAIEHAALPSVDRAKLAHLIFSDDMARKALGELMHPAIRSTTDAAVANALAEPSCPLIVVEIPLLYENRLETTVDRVLVAYCSEETQLGRLMERRPGLTRTEALQQICSQIPIGEKAARADFVIDTDRPITETRREADSLYDRMIGGA